MTVKDHLGTAQILLDNQGVVVWQGNYTPFGEVDVIVNNVANYFRFPGQIFDPESGVHYNWNRYYNPETGRYISADPIGLDGGLNLFAYVGDDPVNWGDLFGMKRTWTMKKSGGGVGYLVVGLSVHIIDFVSNCEDNTIITKSYLVISPALTVGLKITATWGESKEHFGGTTFMKKNPNPISGFSASGPSAGFIKGGTFGNATTDFNSFGGGNVASSQNMIGASFFNVEGNYYMPL